MARTSKTQGSKDKNASRYASESAPTPAEAVTRSSADKRTDEKPARRMKFARGSKLNPSQLLAELVGTFVLTLVVVAALSGKFALSFFATPQVLQQATATGQAIPSFALMPFVGGLALVVLVLAIYKISGGYLNPAIVVGQVILRRIQLIQGAGYIVAQFIGAMLALTIASRLITVFDPTAGQAVLLNPANLFSHASGWSVFSAELLGAFVFGFGAAAAYKYRALPRAVILGGSFVLGIAVASMAGAGILNPALAVGVGLVGIGAPSVAEGWALAGIYLGGSILGVVVGMVLHSFLSRGISNRELDSNRLSVTN